MKYIEDVEEYVIIDEMERRGYEVHRRPRNYQVEPLSELLCERYNLSRHTKANKLLELVEKELNI